MDSWPDDIMAEWIDPTGFPESLEITATDANGHIMALRHKTLDALGAISSRKCTDA